MLVPVVGYMTCVFGRHFHPVALKSEVQHARSADQGQNALKIR